MRKVNHMSIKVDDLKAECADTCMAYASWALENGIWDGRPVSLSEASHFKDEAIQRIAGMLFSHESNYADFHKMSANLAWIGANEQNRFEIYQDIAEIGLTPEGMIVHAGLGKSLKKFWKKHKVEILVGIAVVAVVTAIAIATISSGGAAAGVVAAAGGMALDDQSESKKGASRPNRPSSVKLDPPTNSFDMSSMMPPTAVPGKMTFVENGVMLDGQYLSYNDILQRARFEEFLNSARSEDMTVRPPALPPSVGDVFPHRFHPGTIQSSIKEEKSWFRWGCEGIGRDVLELDSGLEYAKAVSPHTETSQKFSTPGIRVSNCRIGGINGMNTSLAEAISHANYLNEIASNHSIDWVYNHSNGVAKDLAEIFTMNYAGYSPNTEKLLRETWIQFHEENKNNPNAKYLFFCFSQGTIHAKNTLLSLPEEIRKRIIIVAIAPAAIIPKDLCYDSFNYASKKDIVPLGEATFASIVGSGQDGRSELLQTALDHREQLIYLDPHPEATMLDHEFQSPTFADIIQTYVDDHISKNGEYK